MSEEQEKGKLKKKPRFILFFFLILLLGALALYGGTIYKNIFAKGGSGPENGLFLKSVKAKDK